MTEQTRTEKYLRDEIQKYRESGDRKAQPLWWKLSPLREFCLKTLKGEFLDIWVKSHYSLSSEELEIYIDQASSIAEAIEKNEPDWHPRDLADEYDKTGLPVLSYIRWRAHVWHYQRKRIEEREDLSSKRHKALKKIRSSTL